MKITNLNTVELDLTTSFTTHFSRDTINRLADVTGAYANDRNRKVSAIKLVRDLFGCGLKEAKLFVEEASRTDYMISNQERNDV